MKIYRGKPVFKGIAIGRIAVYERSRLSVSKDRKKDAAEELKRFETARRKAGRQLDKLAQETLKQADRESAAIFEAHRVMLDDVDYVGAVTQMIIRDNTAADYAVEQVSSEFIDKFLMLSDEYFRERAKDIEDVSKRLISILQGQDSGIISFSEPVIVLAEDLSPSETMQMEKDKILSFVTIRGSVNSHAAILSKAMGIPSLVGMQMKADSGLEGRPAAVDGFEGLLYVDPDEETILRLEEKQASESRRQAGLRTMIGKKSITKDGRKIAICANIAETGDLNKAVENDAEGIGLFRSEFLYLGREDYPSEEEQFAAYRAAAEKMKGKKVIIRTLDIGADKQADYFDLREEENPAMGYRAIRICLDRTDMFKTQLRAIYRASAYGPLAVMYPMIISIEEIRRIQAILREVEGELSAGGYPFGQVEQGIMVETPAAAVISDLLAREVDFLSIGTNDLTQYMLAIDRQNPMLIDRYDPYHPAVLRLLRQIVDNGHTAGKWVGICGELAADTRLTEQFLRMGVDELSVTPSFILELRKKIRGLDIKNERGRRI